MDPRIRIHPKMSWIRNTGFDITTHHAGKGEDRGHQVVEDGRLDGHASLQQHGEVANFVRQLVAQHRHARRETW